MTDLTHKFTTLCDEAVQSAQQTRTRVIARDAKRGLDESTLPEIEAAYRQAALATMNEMGCLAAAAVPPAWDALERGYRQVRDRMAEDLSQFFRDEAHWAPAETRQELAKWFFKWLDGTSTSVVDDLRRGRVFARRPA